ncbi:hypothetical protein [Vibrio phage vB_VmeM-Yong XC32]|nr:hypothetical protein [Vibrio phage vB_VmeM-Yong XC31]QAX96565.1 hypothetical protein [Vibrio phage vB_VmeM-Yong XC32]QAX96883.1 hypothetical protein [Vibrio phage vB_VmeM-Yong MS31]QAX97188.1 hypothetical protein [Vibrio phage vB_VmeM-Yong MS32]
MTSKKVRSMAWFRDYFSDANSGVENGIPDGFEITSENGAFTIVKIVGEDRHVLGSMGMEESFFRDSIRTGSSSVQVGGRHSMGSAGENAGFINLHTNIFYHPGLWHGIGIDGEDDYLETTRHLEKLEEVQTDAGGYGSLFIDYNFLANPFSFNFCLHRVKFWPEAYRGRIVWETIMDGGEVSKAYADIDTDGNTEYVLQLPYPIFVPKGKAVIYRVTKENGAYLRIKNGDTDPAVGMRTGYLRRYDDYQAINGYCFITASGDYLHNAHHLVDASGGAIVVDVEDNKHLAAFSIRDANGTIGGANTLEIQFGGQGSVNIVNPNHYYTFVKDKAGEWWALNEITGVNRKV